MAFESLTSELTLDASDYTGGADDAASASEDLASSVDNTGGSLFDLDPAGVAAGAAIAGLGAGMQSVIGDTQDMRESLGRTAVSMDMTTDETNSLARSMSDATFPLEDVTATMDSLARQGVETEEDMQDVAVAMDMMADATGTTAESVAESAGPAMRAFGHDLTEAEDHMDTFTFVARNTTMDIEEFSSSVERMAPELQEMGLSMDDTAVMMAALEEQGITGRQAITEFRQATNAADGDQEELMEQLGLTEDELREQESALADADGATEEFSESANESVTTMDRMRAKLDDAKLAAGGMLGPVDALAPALMGLGAAQSLVASINFSAVIPSLVGVMTAAAPVVIPLLAIIGVVGALYYAWENNIFGIRDIAADAFDTITGIVDTAREFIPNAVAEATEKAQEIFFKWHPAGIIWRKRDEIMDALPSVSDFRSAATGLVDSFISGIRSKISDTKSVVSDLASAVRDQLPFSPAKEGPLSDLDKVGPALVTQISGDISDNEDEVPKAMEAALVPGSSSGGAGGRELSVDIEGDMVSALEQSDRTDDILDRIDRLIRALQDELDVEITLDPETGRYDRI